MEKSSPEKLILVTHEAGGIACITINRPHSLNSLTKSMLTDLARIFKSLDADDSVRVIILTGSGRSFCSGIDLTAAEDVFKGDFRDMEIDPVFQMEQCRKPIIGAVAGFAVTGGFEISLACDILVASKDAKFLDTHARFVFISSQFIFFSRDICSNYVFGWFCLCFHYLMNNPYDQIFRVCWIVVLLLKLMVLILRI